MVLLEIFYFPRSFAGASKSDWDSRPAARKIPERDRIRPPRRFSPFLWTGAAYIASESSKPTSTRQLFRKASYGSRGSEGYGVIRERVLNRRQTERGIFPFRLARAQLARSFFVFVFAGLAGTILIIIVIIVYLYIYIYVRMYLVRFDRWVTRPAGDDR